MSAFLLFLIKCSMGIVLLAIASAMVLAGVRIFTGGWSRDDWE